MLVLLLRIETYRFCLTIDDADMKRALLMFMVMSLLGCGSAHTLLDYEGPLPHNIDFPKMVSPIGLCDGGEMRLVAPAGKDYAVAVKRLFGPCINSNQPVNSIVLGKLNIGTRYWFYLTKPRRSIFASDLEGTSPPVVSQYQYAVNSGPSDQYRDIELLVKSYPSGDTLRFGDDYSSVWSIGEDTLVILAYIPTSDRETQIELNILSCGSLLASSPGIEICIAMEVDLSNVPFTGKMLKRKKNAHREDSTYSNGGISGIIGANLSIDPIFINSTTEPCTFYDTPKSAMAPAANPMPIFIPGTGLDVVQDGCHSPGLGIPELEIQKGLHNLCIYWFIPLEGGFYEISMYDAGRSTSMMIFRDDGAPAAWGALPQEQFGDSVFARLSPEICNDIAVGRSQSMTPGKVPGLMKEVKMIGGAIVPPSLGGTTIFPCGSEESYFFEANKIYYVVISGPVTRGLNLLNGHLALSDTILGELKVHYCSCRFAPKIVETGHSSRTIPLPPDHPKGYDTYTWAPMPADPYQSRRLKINANIQGELQVYRCKDPGDYGTYEILSTRKVMPHTRNQSIDILNASACEGLRILVAYKGDAVVQLDLEAESLDPPPEPQVRRKAR
jgi:hypothetical protein